MVATTRAADEDTVVTDSTCAGGTALVVSRFAPDVVVEGRSEQAAAYALKSGRRRDVDVVGTASRAFRVLRSSSGWVSSSSVRSMMESCRSRGGVGSGRLRDGCDHGERRSLLDCSGDFVVGLIALRVGFGIEVVSRDMVWLSGDAGGCESGRAPSSAWGCGVDG